MSAQSRRLLTAFLAVSIVLSTVCLPVGAAVKPGQQMPACSGPGNISGDTGGNGAFIMDRTEKQTPVDISSAKWKTVGGHLRLLSSDGKYRTGFVRVNGRLYFFDSKGNLTTGFFTYKGKILRELCQRRKGKGQILTGLVRIGTYFYFLNPASTPCPELFRQDSRKSRADAIISTARPWSPDGSPFQGANTTRAAIRKVLRLASDRRPEDREQDLPAGFQRKARRAGWRPGSRFLQSLQKDDRRLRTSGKDRFPESQGLRRPRRHYPRRTR